MEKQTTSFDVFMSQLKVTNQSLASFCDFEKITNNVENIKLSLCMLNSLIGSTDLRKSVETIWERDKSAFAVMEILIAVRSRDNKKFIDAIGQTKDIKELFNSVDNVMVFLNETGLADLFNNLKIKDLVDYVFGVETGLDTNARKNRGGEIMEGIVAKIFKEHSVSYRKEVYSREWPEISQALGNDEKRFDFVIKTSLKTYLIEVNFYTGGGSKLNEVARAYSDIAPKINAVPGFEFVWITDGIGWNSARNKLQEAYSIIPSIYNLTTINDFIDGIIKE